MVTSHSMSCRLVVLAALLPSLALAASSVDIGKLEGVYRRSFQNGDTSGAKFVSTDILEIVRFENESVYFRTELNFFNGHICELSGIAESEQGVLVYRDDSRGPNEPCVLRLVPARRRIRFEDVDGHCRKGSCGARGGYDDTTFSLARRRKISNLGTARLAGVHRCGRRVS
jgi:hypothetical protein